MRDKPSQSSCRVYAWEGVGLQHRTLLGWQKDLFFLALSPGYRVCCKLGIKLAGTVWLNHRLSLRESRGSCWLLLYMPVWVCWLDSPLILGSATLSYPLGDTDNSTASVLYSWKTIDVHRQHLWCGSIDDPPMNVTKI